jgi:ABC-type transporter Mla subunit MlaD
MQVSMLVRGTALLATPSSDSGVPLSNRNGTSGAILSADLARAFSAAAGTTFDALASLRVTVCEFVRVQQKSGASLESVIERVHRVFDAASHSVSESEGALPSGAGDRRALIERLTVWCAEAYRP